MAIYEKMINEALGCIFQSNPATDSRRFRPVIPFHSGHPFHSIPATGFGE